MKILTKYAVKPYFYNVILRMIFWNMKYLFYNCQLLLLCCVCCKFAIQAFVQEDRQAYKIELAKRLTVLPMDRPTTWNPSVFYRELQKNYRILPHSPTAILTDWYPSVFYRELQKNYRIFPHSPTVIPMDWYPSVFYRELQKNYRIFPHSLTAIPTDCYPLVFYRELQKHYNPCHNHRWIYRCIHWQMTRIPKRTTVRLPSRSA